MPALKNVPHVAKVVFSGVTGSRPWANVMHVEYGVTGGNLDPADVQYIADQLEAKYAARFMPNVPSSTSLLRVDVTDLNSPTGLAAANVTTVAGGLAGPAASANCGTLINWTIGRRYRGGHPRTYLPSIQEGDVDAAGVVIAARQTALNTATTGFISDLATLTLPVRGTAPSLVCVHYRLANVILDPPLVDPVINGKCNTLIGSQRRRVRS